MLIKNQKGQGLIEYLIIVALVGVATMAAVKLLAQSTNYKLAQVISAIQGEKSEVQSSKPAKPNKQIVRKKDFSNFMQGAINRASSQDKQ